MFQIPPPPPPPPSSQAFENTYTLIPDRTWDECQTDPIMITRMESLFSRKRGALHRSGIGVCNSHNEYHRDYCLNACTLTSRWCLPVHTPCLAQPSALWVQFCPQAPPPPLPRAPAVCWRFPSLPPASASAARGSNPRWSGNWQILEDEAGNVSLVLSALQITCIMWRDTNSAAKPKNCLVRHG